MSAARRKTGGLRFTERFLLPWTGPANVGSDRARTPVTPLQRERAERLEQELERVVGADGRSYLVTRAADPRA